MASLRVPGAAVLGLLLLAIGSLPAAEYQFVDIGTLGGPMGHACDINNRGQVTGYSFAVPQSTGVMDYSWVDGLWVPAPQMQYITNAFLYDNGQMIDLGRSSDASRAYALNESTLVVGDVGWADNHKRAFRTLYGPLNETGDAGFLNGTIEASVARGVNDRGQVVGNAFDTHGYFPYVYENGRMRSLGPLLGGPSFVKQINNLGKVAGDSFLNADRVGPIHAIVHDTNTGKTTDLGLLASSDWGANSGGQRYANESHAFAINDKGQVVGQSYVDRDPRDTYPTQHAFLWEAGTMTDLGTLPGTNFSSASDINENGEIVGMSGGRAFLYRDGQMIDLNTLIDPIPGGWRLYEATAINDVGQIVGYMTDDSFGERAFLLNPLPEETARFSMRAFATSLGLLADHEGDVDPRSLEGTFSPAYRSVPADAPVPEPSTALGLISGAVGLGLVRLLQRRRRAPA